MDSDWSVVFNMSFVCFGKLHSQKDWDLDLDLDLDLAHFDFIIFLFAGHSWRSRLVSPPRRERVGDLPCHPRQVPTRVSLYGIGHQS